MTAVACACPRCLRRPTRRHREVPLSWLDDRTRGQDVVSEAWARLSADRYQAAERDPENARRDDL